MAGGRGWGHRGGGYDRGIVTAVTARVPAKVNLQLSVGPPGADGYHDLVTVFHALALFDEVTVASADTDSVVVTGEGAHSVPLGPDNLAARAVAALLDAVGPGVRDAPGLAIEIRKRIPVAAGLAGGSADAAGALVACNELWGAGLSHAELGEVAANVGSDVGFALLGGTAVGLGRGDRVTPALAAGTYHWVLAFADGQLSTPAVYAACDRLRAARADRAGRAGSSGKADPPDPSPWPAAAGHGPDGRAARGRPGRAGPAAEQRPAARRGVAAAPAAPGAGRGPGARRTRRHRVRLRAHLRVPGPGRGARTRPGRRAGRGRGVPDGGQRDGPRPRRNLDQRADRGIRAHMNSPAVNLVNLERAVKAYGQRPLLDGVSAGVAAGDRIGIVGRNGAGKSTLLSVLAGTAELDSGRATRTRGLRTGVLAQRSELTGTVASVVIGDLPEHAWAANPRTRSVLAALLPGIDLAAPADRLSGGESRRVALAAVLIGEHDLLLLDEPTNHLDVEAIDWLARHLAGRPEALAAVTHDRWFLDAVCNRTWELADGRVHAYDGGYSAYVLARAERARVAEATDRRRRNLLRKELAWLRRGPPARTSKPRFRVDAANALIEGEPPARDGVELIRLATARLGRTVIEAEDVSVTVQRLRRLLPRPSGVPSVSPEAGSPRTLLRDVTWQLGPGERVGLIGPNGSGKSTLLDLLAGVDEAGEGGGPGEQADGGDPGEQGGGGGPGERGGRRSGSGRGRPGRDGRVAAGGDRRDHPGEDRPAGLPAPA